MDMIRLPIIGRNASLNEAIDVLKGHGCRGVVVEHVAAPVVLDVDLIVHALRKQGNVKIRKLKPRLRAVRAAHREPAAKLMRGSRGFEMQELLDTEGAAYVVARSVNGEAEVLGRYEPYTFLIGGPPDLWRCTFVSTHVWVTSDLRQPGNKCRYDGEPAVPV